MVLARSATLVLAVLLWALPAAGQIDRIDPSLDGESPAAAPADQETAPAADETPPPAPAIDPYELQLEALASRFQEGVDAWRRGEYELARGRWLAVLNELEASSVDLRGRERVFDRHALLHDLGNAAFRMGEPLEAVAWYQAALRHAPRDRETRANLAMARRAAQLEEEAGGDFARSVWDSFDLVTTAEARWLALLALGPLLIALLGEAVRGGRAWRAAVFLALLAAGAGAAPLGHHLIVGETNPVMVVETDDVPIRAEPLDERPPIGALVPGEMVERLDALPDWVRIEREDGTRGWLPAASVFPLDR